jgi:hypothetical protein
MTFTLDMVTSLDHNRRIMKHGFQLLRALDKVGGQAIVQHAGDRPYIVTSTQRWESPLEPITMPVMRTMLADLLPGDPCDEFDEMGSMKYDTQHLQQMPAAKFTVVAGWFSSDLWVELRRDAMDAPDRNLQIPTDDELFPLGQRRSVN